MGEVVEPCVENLPRLGPAWVDRLINAALRRLGPLDEADARELICHPVPDIDHSEIYLEGAEPDNFWSFAQEKFPCSIILSPKVGMR